MNILHPNTLAAPRSRKLRTGLFGLAVIFAGTNGGPGGCGSTYKQSREDSRAEKIINLIHKDGFQLTADGETAIYDEGLGFKQVSTFANGLFPIETTPTFGSCEFAIDVVVQFDKSGKDVTGIDHYEIETSQNGIEKTFTFTSESDMEARVTGPNPCDLLTPNAPAGN